MQPFTAFPSGRAVFIKKTLPKARATPIRKVTAEKFKRKPIAKPL